VPYPGDLKLHKLAWSKTINSTVTFNRVTMLYSIFAHT